MYYFGVLHAYWFFTRFGVDYTVMGLTPPDYVLRSADGLFVPLTACGAAGLAGLWIWRLLPVTAPARLTALGTPLLPALGAVLGLGLLLVALAAVVRPALLDEPLGVPGLALAAGVLILAAASRSTGLIAAVPPTQSQRRRSLPLPVAVAEWAAIFLVVSAGLFWAAGDYSAAVGTRRGNDVVAALPTWPDVTVFAERSLNLSLPGVREQRCADTGGSFAYRYDGLKLIVQSGNQLMFLPATWADGSGTALVIPRNDTIRLEFTSPGASLGRSC